jgi:uncharacterized protein YkwD
MWCVNAHPLISYFMLWWICSILRSFLQIQLVNALFTLICNPAQDPLKTNAADFRCVGEIMNRRTAMALGISALALSACGMGRAPNMAAAAQRGGGYRIDAAQAQAIPFRALDSINAIRSASGLGQLQFSAELNAASLTHSRDMSVQNRPWHFGSDGSSPLLRAQRVGFQGRFLGELISETFETELQTISAWMKNPATRSVLLDPAATLLGFAWFQEPNGKIWWTLMTGA